MTKKKSPETLQVKEKGSTQTKNKTAQIMSATHIHEGPIPPPAILEGYDRVVPGAAERIIKMAEQQSAHRRLIENKVIDSNIRNSRLGIWCGTIICIVALLVAGFCAYIGQPWPAGFIGSGGLTGLVSVFIYGTKSQKDERLDKFKKMRQ